MSRTSTDHTPNSKSVAQVAAYLHCGEDKVRHWINSGELAAVNISTSLLNRPRWRITPAALADFERRRAGGPPPKPVRRRRQSQAKNYFPDIPV